MSRRSPKPSPAFVKAFHLLVRIMEEEAPTTGAEGDPPMVQAFMALAGMPDFLRAGKAHDDPGIRAVLGTYAQLHLNDPSPADIRWVMTRIDALGLIHGLTLIQGVPVCFFWIESLAQGLVIELRPPVIRWSPIHLGLALPPRFAAPVAFA